jgi:class 3 adenylate cyclase
MQDDSASATPRPALERRLATIMMADVVGYSRMMGENEERTIGVLRGHREVFDALLKLHRGRIFNTAGDSILAEFPSAVEAVRCATEAQAALRTRNDHLPPEQRMQFRIGINLGDVVVQGGDLLGDGVNVAARIQTVAEPGGICISGSVYDQIQNKLSLQFRQLGEKSFKNISQPIRTFSISDAEEGSPEPGGGRSASAKKAWVWGIAAVMAAALAVGAHTLYRSRTGAAEEARVADSKQQAVKESASTEAAQQQAKLQAELQAAREALQRAETSKVKSEQERNALETAQREARLQAELKAAKDALAKAEQSTKNNDAESKAAMAMRIAENAARFGERVYAQSAGRTQPRAEAPESEAKSAPVVPPSTAPAAVAAMSDAAARTGSARYDGEYFGHMCSINADKSPRCWNTAVTVKNGALSTTWPSRFERAPAHGKGAISADGIVNIALDGFSSTGRVLSGDMAGNWVDNTISVTGAWNNHVPLSATWARAR